MAARGSRGHFEAVGGRFRRAKGPGIPGTGPKAVGRDPREPRAAFRNIEAEALAFFRKACYTEIGKENKKSRAKARKGGDLMGWFHKKEKAPAFDAEALQPAVRRSYCNREMTLGFIEKSTGKFRAQCCAFTQKELEDFCRSYGIKPEDLKTIY